MTILNITHQAKKKSRANLTVVGWNNNRVVYIASSKSSKPKIFVWRLNEIGKTIFKNNNQINSTVTTRTQVFLTEWTRTLPSKWLVSEWKVVVIPLAWMFDVILQNAWILRVHFLKIIKWFHGGDISEKLVNTFNLNKLVKWVKDMKIYVFFLM